MKKIHPPKLTLTRETLAPLTEDPGTVRGGLASRDSAILCTLHCVLTSTGC